MKRMDDLYAYVSAVAGGRETEYRDTTACRNRLLQMMDSNQWFGMPHDFEGGTAHTVLTDGFREQLPLWLDAFGKDTRTKAALLLERYSRDYPLACQSCREFLEERDLWGNPSTLAAVDHLVCTMRQLGKELSSFSDAEVFGMYAAAAGTLGQAPFRALQGITSHALPDYAKSWEYTLEPYAEIPDDEKSAYPAMVYARLAWYALNDDSWAQNGLIEKARGDAALSRRWLFLAMHFTCSLRATDLYALPAPVLDEPPEMVAARILDSPDREKEAAWLAQEWGRQLRMLSNAPNKTRRFRAVPDLLVRIPRELEVPLGTILATSLLHYSESNQLIAGPLDPKHLRALFGQGVVDLLGGHGFSTRRANKSYVQGIASATGGDSAKGYVLAAMARSHKGGLGSLAATTDIYLRDATFAGYDPSYILRQLLERGPMSWVAVRFLEHQDKEAFRSITVAGQTALVRDLGLSPLQLESLWGACSAAGTLAQTAVAAVFYGGGTPRERLGEVLEGMARGGRDACVCRATGGTCREPGRGSCLWCPHSLLAPALATEVMKEYVGLQERLHALEEGPSRKRLEAILEDGCLPVVRGLQEMAGGKCPAVRRIIREAALMVREMEDNKDKRK